MALNLLHPEPAGALSEPARLRAVRALLELDLPRDSGLDRLARLAASALSAPTAAVNLVTHDRQLFHTHRGLSRPLADRGEVAARDSFCQFVVTGDAPFLVPDARSHGVLGHSPLVTEHGWVSYAGAPIRAPEGHVVGALCVVDSVRRDWTSEQAAFLADLAAVAAEDLHHRLARRDASVARRASEAQLRALFEEAAVGMVLRDSAGRLVASNPAARRLLGYTEHELAGLSLEAVTHPADWATEAPLLARLMSGEIDHYQLEKRYVCGDWKIRWVRVNVSRVGDGVDSAPAILSVLEDITDAKQLEAEHRARERFYRTLWENATDVALIIDPDGTVRYQSPSAERVLGRGTANLIGRKAFDSIHPEDRERVRALLRDEVARPNSRVSGVYRRRHVDGTWRYMEATATNLLHDPAVGGIVINARDVTVARRLEEELRQAQKMEAIGRLAGAIAHDFNNLLTAITGHAELALGDLGPSSPLHDDVEEIRRSAATAASLTRQLLAFSRKQILRPEVLDLRDVVHDLERMLRRVVPETMALDIAAPGSACCVRADPGQLEQVILNLVVNACDAMPSGGRIEIQVRHHAVEHDFVREQAPVPAGPYLVLSVRDTGAGIPEELRTKIFEPFFTTKDLGKGTGLGLATVYGIVKQSGGYIWVDTEVGRGTMFEIWLPRVDGPASVPARLASRPVAAATGGGERILVVEDQPAVRELVTRVLRRLGYRVIAAGDGQEALELLRTASGPIQLVLTDLVMPGMSGARLATELRRVEPGMRVVFMTGYSQEEILEKDGLDPEVVVLRKPFTPAQLGATIRAALG